MRAEQESIQNELVAHRTLEGISGISLIGEDVTRVVRPGYSSTNALLGSLNDIVALARAIDNAGRRFVFELTRKYDTHTPAIFHIIPLFTMRDNLFRFILDRKSTRLNSSHSQQSRMPSSA